MTQKFAVKRVLSGDEGVSSLIEYLMISGVLVTLFIIAMLTINNVMIEIPVNNLLDKSFVDIGNGVSTRMVEVYVIAPEASQDSRQSNQIGGRIITKFDIPDDVVGRDYYMYITPSTGGKDTLIISRWDFKNDISVAESDPLAKTISLAGIGARLRLAGNTSGRGVNQIVFN